VSKNATTVVVRVPAKAAGVHAVVVTTPAGTATVTGGYTYFAPPTITTVAPLFGSALGGTRVTITGTAMADVTEVKFGTTAATIVSKTATTVIVTTPAVTAGAVSLSMTNTGGTTVRAAAFTFRDLPTVSGMTPTQGSTPGGINATITGTNLATTSSVTFGGTAGTIVSKNATTVVVRVPAKAAGVHAVVVTTPAGTATVTGGYTYFAPPTITSVSPTAGSITGGTTVTITGTNLLAVTTVTLGTVEVTPTTKTATTIRFVAPSTETIGSRAITVTSPGGTVTRNAAFNYTRITARGAAAQAAIEPSAEVNRPNKNDLNAVPQTLMKRGSKAEAAKDTPRTKPATNRKPQRVATSIMDKVSPQSACTATAAVEPYARCYIDYEDTASYDADILYTAAYVKAASPTILTVDTVPVYPIWDSNWLLHEDTWMQLSFDTDGDSWADVVVIPVFASLAANRSTSVEILDYDPYYDDFEVRGANCSGTITRKAGDHVAISGTANTWWQLNINWSCLFQGDASNMTFQSYMEDYDDYDFAPEYFDELPAGNLNSITEPTITTVAPTSGPTAGGTSVTLTGRNLATTSRVEFDGVAGTIVSKTATTVVVRTPAHSAGSVDIEVTAPNGTGYKESGFTYVAAVPTITSISPASGTTDGGTTVVITGTNLGNVTQVQLGGQVAQVVSKTATTLTFITPPAPTTSVVDEPTDPRYVDRSLWGLDGEFGVDAPTAWGTTQGSSDIVVAVIDTGRTNHADEGTTVAGYDMIALDDTDGNGSGDSPLTANDGNGRDSDPTDPGDWISTNEANGVSANGWFEGCDPGDSSWHGTHVAGTINAAANASGIVGVAPGVKVQHVRVLGKCGGYMSDIIAGVTWASGGVVAGVPTNATPARVINMSLGGGGSCSSAMQTAINGAVARGTTVVVAAGNESMNAESSSPANCNNIVVVGAIDSDGFRANFSNYGSIVDVAGPGVGILSTINLGRTNPTTGGYASYNGTSMATPHVAGVVALMLSANDGLSPATVESILKSTAGPFGGTRCDPASSMYSCGAGAVNAGSAVMQ
jgi:serine protease